MVPCQCTMRYSKPSVSLVGLGLEWPLLCSRHVQVARSSHELSDYRLFPCLRATADLLMMPKEVGFAGWDSLWFRGKECGGCAVGQRTSHSTPEAGLMCGQSTFSRSFCTLLQVLTDTEIEWESCASVHE